MIEEFRKYVDSFDFADKNIERKYYHSLRVKSLCQLIAKDLGFNDEDLKIAEVVGLLHDDARFEQWTNYHTFSDIDSIDHGDYAVKELFDKDIISKFYSNKEGYDEIYDAIKYHNKLDLPDYLSKHNEAICKVVRDADKLDIFYLYASLTLVFPEEGEINSKVKEAFDKGMLVDKKDEISDADHGVTVLALIYDLNFDYSFGHLKKYKIIDQIYENIKDKEKFKYYFDKINSYIETKL